MSSFVFQKRTAETDDATSPVDVNVLGRVLELLLQIGVGGSTLKMAPKADLWEMEMPSKVKRRGDAVVFTALNISRKGR